MRVRRVAVTDRFVEDGESVVLVDHAVIRLSALPTAILEAIATWTEVDDLAAMLERQFGPPPDGGDSSAATERTLRELHERGLIERD
jgi:hypothetical protein